MSTEHLTEVDVAEQLPELDVVTANLVTTEVEEVEAPGLHFSNETQVGIEEAEELLDSFDASFEFVNSMETRRFKSSTGSLRVRIRHSSNPRLPCGCLCGSIGVSAPIA